MFAALRKELRGYGNKKRAARSQRFFKTGPGEYGEGDVFLGIAVPVLRKLSRSHSQLALDELGMLMASPYHEERGLALLILVRKSEGAGEPERRRYYQFYVRHLRHINSWDLIDCSAEHIIGRYLLERDKEPLYRWARSRNLWERRIAVMATFHFIKRGRFGETLKIARMLLNDEEDLIHKAVGWMLREIGKRDLAREESFLRKYYRRMPRTMLRYAIERFPGRTRKAYLKGRIA